MMITKKDEMLYVLVMCMAGQTNSVLSHENIFKLVSIIKEEDDSIFLCYAAIIAKKKYILVLTANELYDSLHQGPQQIVFVLHCDPHQLYIVDLHKVQCHWADKPQLIMGDRKCHPVYN